MFDYIKGKIEEINPSFVVIETAGVGYFVNISLNTYSKLSEFENNEETDNISKIFIKQIVREDAHILFGFFNKHERDIFNLLLTVSGVGANTA
jgi:Holliday junction DNA helicase RuvA